MLCRASLILITFMLLTACNNGGLSYNTLPAVGNAEAGKMLFQNGTKDATACSACHSIDGTPESGPSLGGIATRAVTRVPGQSAAEYLFRSIVYPNEFLISGFSAGIMPSNYGSALSPQQIRDLIAYLQTLG